MAKPLSEWMRERVARAGDDDPVSHWLAWPAPPDVSSSEREPKGDPVVTLEHRDDLAEVASELERALADHAEERPGSVAQYVVMAKREGGSIIRARRLLTYQAGAAEGASPTEPPTAAGLVAQAMRHAEACQRQTYQMAELLHRSAAAMVEQATAQIGQHSTTSANVIAAYAKLEQGRAEREERARDGEAKRELIGGIAGEALDMAREFVPELKRAFVLKRIGAGVSAAAPAAIPAAAPTEVAPEPEPEADDDLGRVVAAARRRGVNLTREQAAGIVSDLMGGG